MKLKLLKKAFCFAQRATKSLGRDQSTPQELKVGPLNGPYLLEKIIKIKFFFNFKIEAFYILHWMFDASKGSVNNCQIKSYTKIMRNKFRV